MKINIIFKAVGLAMGVAVIALSIMKQLPTETAIILLGIGVACIGISGFIKEKDKTSDENNIRS